MRQKLLAKLLHLANSGPRDGSNFYEVKKRLLRKYGTCEGGLIQQINKECYGYWNSNWDEYDGCVGDDCLKCNGSGIYHSQFHRLIKWSWCGYSFLIPDDWKYVDAEERLFPDIIGRVEHKDYGKLSSEAELWLYLLAGEWRQFFRQFRGSFYVTPGWNPLLRIQKIWAKPYNFFRNLKRNIGWKYREVRDRIWPPEVPF